MHFKRTLIVTIQDSSLIVVNVMFFDVKIGSLSNFRLSLSTKYNFKIIETCSVYCKNYFCNFHNKGTLFSKALWRSYGFDVGFNGKLCNVYLDEQNYILTFCYHLPSVIIFVWNSNHFRDEL